MTRDDRSKRGSVPILRRAIVGLVIGSFGIAALGGIAVLLGGELGTTGGRVLTTTVVIGTFSAAVLCCTVLVGRRLQVFGVIGAAISIATAAFVTGLVWSDEGWNDLLWRILWTGVACTVAFSFASLLLLLADRTQIAVRIGLATTLGLFAVVLGMTLLTVWREDAFDGDLYYRTLGIAAILAALGAIVVPVLSLLLRGRSSASGIPAETLERLERAAAERGVTTGELVDRLLVALPPVAEDRRPLG